MSKTGGGEQGAVVGGQEAVVGGQGAVVGEQGAEIGGQGAAVVDKGAVVSKQISGIALMRTEDLNKSYTIAGRRLEILSKINIEIKRGEMIAVVGQSGAGKSSLLHVLGALDAPDSGKVFFEEFDMSK